MFWPLPSISLFEVLLAITKSHDVLIWQSFCTMLEPSVSFLLEHLENVVHVSDFFHDTFRFDTSRGDAWYLHRFHLPVSPSVTVTTGKPGSFQQQQTNQPHQTMTKRVDCVQDSIELYQGRNVFTL